MKIVKIIKVLEIYTNIKENFKQSRTGVAKVVHIDSGVDTTLKYVICWVKTLNIGIRREKRKSIFGFK